MEFQDEYCAWSPAEWDELWHRRPPTLSLAHGLLGSRLDSLSLLNDASHFLGGVALGSKFRLFHNGGTPLLERRRGAWTEEIVFRTPPSYKPGIWTPLTLQIHLSCSDILDVRSRYWSVLSKPPRVLASGNIGQLETPERWYLWNLAAGSPVNSVVEKIAARITDDAFPWFDAFGNPAKLRRRLYEGGIPLLDPIASVEWCLYEFGVGEANEYLRKVVLKEEVLKESVHRLCDRSDTAFLEGGASVPFARNLAALVATYGFVL